MGNIDQEIPLLQRKYTRLVDLVADSNDLDMSDIAPRIKELKREIDRLTQKRDKLSKESKTISYNDSDRQKLVEAYVSLIRTFISDGSLMTNTSIRKFIRRIDFNYPNYQIQWKLPAPEELKGKKVLPAVDLVAGAGLEPATFGL